ncbi:transmembrane protease serine 3 [Patella vulgata]|uniref:transmembrane protease serine 3 n=1 Tax=Patella vulgata TaxID=6465 RepID=UPI00217F2B39|nr:transmembrane protease serine 3 [Patella vulgata]
MFGSCDSGQKMSFSHCGFLKKCCYNENKPQGTQAPLTSSEQCGHRLVASDDRIIGGKSALSGEYPWQVSLRYQGQHLCGGTLIDRQWVLTAAHCFEQTYVNGWTAAIGITDLRNLYSSHVYSAADIITHGSFDSTSNSHDIALMKLSKPVDISGTASRTACLPDSTEDFNNVVCTVSGWGSTRFDGPGSRYLNQVSIPVMSNSLCSYYLGNVVYDHNICAGINAGGRDACQGDSGGPLVCKTEGSWKIAGIVSWGYGCGDKNTPGVYTRVSSFLDWIKQVKQGYP